MENRIISFGIWCAMGFLLIALAVFAWFSKKPMRFWANAEVFEVWDVKKYNRAISKLFGIFGIVLMLLGIPLLAEQNSAWILFSILGVMVESIIMMVVYSLGIEKKYKKQKR